MRSKMLTNPADTLRHRHGAAKTDLADQWHGAHHLRSGWATQIAALEDERTTLFARRVWHDFGSRPLHWLEERHHLRLRATLGVARVADTRNRALRLHRSDCDVR